MIKISIITLFPNMVSAFISESIVKRAIEKKLVEIEIIDLRKYAIDDYGTVDDRPYGGGAGMVLRIEPIHKAISNIKNQVSKIKTKTVLTSAKGKVFNQQKAKEYSQLDHVIIIAGHYEGVDERVVEYIDEEISLGDFVMTGGEIAAAAITDAVVRLQKGVLKKEDAVEYESFFEVKVSDLAAAVGQTEKLTQLLKKGIKKVLLLEYPHYTRPEVFEGKKVPEVLLSGNHKKVERWRLQQAWETTLKKRPDIIKQFT